jgi:hypothetical protein
MFPARGTVAPALHLLVLLFVVYSVLLVELGNSLLCSNFHFESGRHSRPLSTINLCISSGDEVPCRSSFSLAVHTLNIIILPVYRERIYLDVVVSLSQLQMQWK